MSGTPGTVSLSTNCVSELTMPNCATRSASGSNARTNGLAALPRRSSPAMNLRTPSSQASFACTQELLTLASLMALVM